MSKLFTRAFYVDEDHTSSHNRCCGTEKVELHIPRNEWKRTALQKKFIPLGLLSIHTSITTFVMQLSRKYVNIKQQQQPSPALVCLSSELLKIILCLFWIFIWPNLQRMMKDYRFTRRTKKQSINSITLLEKSKDDFNDENSSINNSSKQNWNHLFNYIFSTQGFIMIIPSILYVLQNMLQISAIPYMSAVAYQSICQFKIVATALLSILILGSRINRKQWICLIMLTLGVIDLLALQRRRKDSKSNQDIFTTTQTTTAIIIPSIQYWDVNPFIRKSNHQFTSYTRVSKAITRLPTTKLAIMAVILASILGSLSGVYLESRLKIRGDGNQTKKLSLAMKNACLATYSIVTLLFIVMIEHICKGGSSSSSSIYPTHLACFDHWTLLFIALRAFGGLLVAASLQYADSISKNFAVCLAIITTSLLEYIFNGSPLTTIINEGTFMILFSSLSYIRIV